MRLCILAFGITLLPLAATAQPSSADYSSGHEQRALEIFRRSIGYRTAISHGQVPGYASYLADELLRGGFPQEDVHVLPLTLPSGEVTASLVARYRASGASAERPILLLAHMDVVEALPEDWERDPFTLVEEDGFFFGRGTLDNKNGVAMILATFLRLKQEGFVPRRDLILAFTGDEETAMFSSARALTTTHRDLVDAEFALNSDAGHGVLDESGRPTSYLVQTAEKTYATLELTITNSGGHSARPRTDNAIYDLAKVLARIENHRFPVQVNEATRRYFELSARITPGPAGEAMGRLATNPDDTEAADILWHYPEEVGFTRTTCIPTMLKAGHAENALPQSATATINCRIFPGVEVAEVVETIRTVVENETVTITVLGDPRSSPPSPIDDEVLAAVTAAVTTTQPGTTVIPFMSAYGTDGLEFRRAGIPTYGSSGVFIKASDIFNHGLNERLPVSSFFEGLEYWYALVTDLAGPPDVR
jgi:acetylornithine deacetylase/succinyl-diaminopimelate desuccinylase-like protein